MIVSFVCNFRLIHVQIRTIYARQVNEKKGKPQLNGSTRACLVTKNREVVSRSVTDRMPATVSLLGLCDWSLLLAGWIASPTTSGVFNGKQSKQLQGPRQ